MWDGGFEGFRPIHGPTVRRHGISQSATLSLPSSVMHQRRLIADIAFEGNWPTTTKTAVKCTLL